MLKNNQKPVSTLQDSQKSPKNNILILENLFGFVYCLLLYFALKNIFTSLCQSGWSTIRLITCSLGKAFFNCWILVTTSYRSIYVWGSWNRYRITGSPKPLVTKAQVASQTFFRRSAKNNFYLTLTLTFLCFYCFFSQLFVVPRELLIMTEKRV